MSSKKGKNTKTKKGIKRKSDVLCPEDETKSEQEYDAEKAEANDEKLTKVVKLTDNTETQGKKKDRDIVKTTDDKSGTEDGIENSSSRETRLGKLSAEMFKPDICLQSNGIDTSVYKTEVKKVESKTPVLLSHLNKRPETMDKSMVLNKATKEEKKNPVLLSHLVNREQQMPILLSHLNRKPQIPVLPQVNQAPVVDKQRKTVEFTVDQICSNFNIDAHIEQIVGMSQVLNPGSSDVSLNQSSDIASKQSSLLDEQKPSVQHSMNQIYSNLNIDSQIQHLISMSAGTNPSTIVPNSNQLIANKEMDQKIGPVVNTVGSTFVSGDHGQISATQSNMMLAAARQAKMMLNSYDEVVKGLSAGFPSTKKRKDEIPTTWPQDCSFCKKSITTADEMTFHLAEHRGYKIFSCEICNSKFLVRSQYQSHRKSHKNS